ncbi:MAG TPA: hypothetical protein VHL85_04000 [Burkholderiales bacterium]|jgi:hypothetical protein|nr:hypothetical protein [Burkholderiales bacterium]
MHPRTLIVGLAALIGGTSLYKRYRQRPTGSQTNASDAMDDIHLPSRPTTDEALDAGVKETFPASDAVSSKPSETAYEKQQRMKQSG